MQQNIIPTNSQVITEIKKSKFILQKRKGIVYNLYGYIYKYKVLNKNNKNKGINDEC